jgi:hypothetical protein
MLPLGSGIFADFISLPNLIGLLVWFCNCHVPYNSGTLLVGMAVLTCGLFLLVLLVFCLLVGSCHPCLVLAPPPLVPVLPVDAPVVCC